MCCLLTMNTSKHIQHLLFINRLSRAPRVLNSGFLTKWSIRNSSTNIVHSSLSPVNIPDISIPELVFKDFSKWPDKIAIECALTGKKFTFEELRRKSRNLSRALRKKLKLNAGDVVAILLPNVPEFPICVLGILEAGLIVTTINPIYTPDEIRRQLLDSDAKAIITLSTMCSSACAASKNSSIKIPILTIKLQQTDELSPATIDFREFTDNKLDSDYIPVVSSNDIALLPYSSGTTGLPKGVELLHSNIVANLCQMNNPNLKLSQETTETHQDIIPGILPWFHIYGFTAVMFNSIINHCKLVSMPKFTPKLYVSTLAKHKPHVLYIVPFIVTFMSNESSLKNEYFQELRTIFSGAAPLGKLDEENLLKKIQKPINVLQGYGLTETSPLVFMTDPLKKKKLQNSGSAGEVVGSTSVKIVPADNHLGNPLGPNQPGELYIKGPQVMKGYHKRPTETAEMFVDGWLRTGDLAYYDDKKMFYLTERMKELIKVKGFQVAPAELEEILRSHPNVADAAVIGISHDLDGEVPRAYVVAKRNAKINSENLQEFVAGKVSKYKHLKGGVAVVESIPKNASGKIMRRTLKLQYEQEK